MLLTVIAVATLLVAVVGATFAYFSLSVTNNSSATTASVTTGTAATATLTGSDQKLHLKMSAVDMATTAQGTYYALAESDELYESMSSGPSIHSKDSKKEYTIASISLAGAEEDTTYTCKYKVTVTLSEDLSSVTKGDLVLTLTGPGISSETVDLSEITGEETYTKDVPGTFTLNSDLTSGDVKASLALKNSNVDQSTTLADKNITVTLTTAGDGQCTVAKTVPGA